MYGYADGQIPNVGPTAPTVYKGPAVSVAGVLWDWSATRARYVPGNAVVYGLITDVPALTNTTQDIGLEAWLANSLTPTGKARIYWTGTLWAPVAGQILYGAYGTLLDTTASALSIGAWNEVWQSPVLPEWFFNGSAISLTSEASLADSASTASERLRMTLRTGASSTGDENDAFMGHAAGATASGRGLGGIRVRGNLRNGVIYGNAGASAASLLAQPSRSLGSYGSNARVRLDALPGATTNNIKLFSVELWAGG